MTDDELRAREEKYDSLIQRYLLGEVDRAEVTAADPYVEVRARVAQEAADNHYREQREAEAQQRAEREAQLIKTRKRKSKLWRLWYCVVGG